MLDVTDSELTVTVRVPEGRWLWLVSPGLVSPLRDWLFCLSYQWQFQGEPPQPAAAPCARCQVG